MLKKPLWFAIGAVAIVSSLFSLSETSSLGESDLPDKFVNSELVYQTSAGDMLKILKSYFTVQRDNPVPVKPLPMEMITQAQLAQESQDVVYRLGHSSVLMHLDASWVLADPVFSDRASPVQWAGPKRFHPVPLSVATLPNIDVVVISHDHYDHLDKATVKALNQKVGVFLVPLKVGQRLLDWGVPSNKVIEFDWWQSHQVNGIEFTFTPTQHFSGRGVLDKDSTLWGSWVIKGQQSNLFFSGDSGYFSGFKQIGERFGPFDLTMIETGAYNALWESIHMFPEQSVQAHLDLQGKLMMPIHNSTFDLAQHDWNEPLQRAFEISQENDVTMVSPKIGQRFALSDEPSDTPNWWQE